MSLRREASLGQSRLHDLWSTALLYLPRYLNNLLNKTHAKATWKQFRPSYIRAFNDAKDASVARRQLDDDYVQRREFRLLCAYLCV